MAEIGVLPKYICRGCFDKVSDFHEFYCGVYAAQRNFIDSLMKPEPDFIENVAFSLPSIEDATNIERDTEAPNIVVDSMEMAVDSVDLEQKGSNEVTKLEGLEAVSFDPLSGADLINQAGLN